MSESYGYRPQGRRMMDEDLADWGEPPTFEEEDHIPALRLRWEGASPEQLGFMRRVYERQIRRAQRQRPFVGDVPEDELDVIEGGHKARTEAAADCRALLAAARAALDQDKRAGLPRAQAVESIGLVSAYRSASHQFLNWQRNFPRYYRRTHEHRAGRTGGEHGEAAADYLARYVGKRLAAPGYSRHNDGRAVDFGTREGGEDLGADTSAASISRWRGSWLFEWLTSNAARFNYYQNTLINEPWHWEHQGAGGTARQRNVENESDASLENAEAADAYEQIDLSAFFAKTASIELEVRRLPYALSHLQGL